MLSIADSGDVLPRGCDLSSLGIDQRVLKAVIRLQARPGRSAYRIVTETESYVLKWCDDPAKAVEPRVYRLLGDWGVPTIPVKAITSQAVLLEDLRASSDWRPAEERDLRTAPVGEAVARWYSALHHAGREVVGRPEGGPLFLDPWVEGMTPESLHAAGIKLGVEGESAWRTAVREVEGIKSAYLDLPQTFNYDDFAWDNLALSRVRGKEIDAVVFDYHQFSTGVAFSDWRNVMGELRDDARDGFAHTYGPTDESERILDEPLSTLFSLIVASARPHFPRWAAGLLETVKSGEFERSVKAAKESAEGRQRGLQARDQST